MKKETKQLLNKVAKLHSTEQLQIAKMILMGVADFEYPDNPDSEILWTAKDLVIDFEKAVAN